MGDSLNPPKSLIPLSSSYPPIILHWLWRIYSVKMISLVYNYRPHAPILISCLILSIKSATAAAVWPVHYLSALDFMVRENIIRVPVYVWRVLPVCPTYDEVTLTEHITDAFNWNRFLIKYDEPMHERKWKRVSPLVSSQDCRSSYSI